MTTQNSEITQHEHRDTEKENEISELVKYTKFKLFITIRIQ